MENEKWLDVVGYEGLYEVSNYGKVRTKEGKTTHTKRHGERKWNQRVLKEKNKNGRDVRYSLWRDGKPKSFLAHRLVALAFIGSPPKGKESINHIDGNPRNNYVGNLEWCDHKFNNNHAFDNGLIATGKKVMLTDLEGNALEFRSISKASMFLFNNEKKLFNIFYTNKDREVFVDGYKVKKIID